MTGLSDDNLKDPQKGEIDEPINGPAGNSDFDGSCTGVIGKGVNGSSRGDDNGWPKINKKFN